MEKGNRTLKDIIKVSASNVVVLLTSVLIAFILPKIIGVEDYGYYQTFTLYAAYVGLFHFGIVDGIYLVYGDKNYDQLERTKFRFYTRFLFVLEFLIALIVGVTCFFAIKDENLQFIFICVAVYLLTYNMSGYFQFISQITQRFKELSLRNLVQSLLNIVSLVILFLVMKYANQVISYKIYTLIYVAIQIILMCWYIFTYRDITFGRSEKNLFKDIFSFIKVGLPLLIANLTLILILKIDRQFVDYFFKDKEIFAKYSFAYNMLALITTLTNAISTVLYPSMKRKNEFKVTEYQNLVSIIAVLVFACLLVYYPLDLFVTWFLPNYVDSLPIFRIILPGLILTSVITIVMLNYYKVIGKNLIFFLESLGVLLLSIIANIVAYYIMPEPIAISIASIIIIFIWYLVVEFYFIKKYKVNPIKNLSFIILGCASFYAITLIQTEYIGFLVQLAVTILLILIYFYKDIKNIINKRKKKEVIE